MTVTATLVSAASIYLGSWWVTKVRQEDALDIVMAILQKRLGYLKVDNEDLVAFSEAFQRSLPPKVKVLAGWAGAVEPLYSRTDVLSSFTSTRFIEFEEYVVSKFLLSTDFFQHNADETRDVKYLGLFPYELSCANPLARFDNRG